ncbi:MAG: lipase [Chloroflexaceae bacterium]|jgi:pimeloyl-ACP methyl ester carboxylesterase|nr:lipase [Chloroflexaceae bacterium]
MRPLVLLGGYLTRPGDFSALAAALAAPPYDFQVFTVPVGRVRWAFTRDYDFRPVVSRLRETVQVALEATGAERVTLVAYSVGGTAARIYLGEQPYLGEVYGGRRYVEQLVTLGTPHTSLERWTLKLYRYVNETYPGAYYSEVRYTSVIGQALQGRRNGRFVERMASDSYVMVSGSGHENDWGDGVTSLVAAALPGAEYLVVPGLYHSSFHGKPWYADPAALPRWGRVLGQPALVAV